MSVGTRPGSSEVCATCTGADSWLFPCGAVGIGSALPCCRDTPCGNPGVGTWPLIASSDALAVSACRGCPQLLQNFASSRFGALHNGQIISALLFASIVRQ